MCWFMASTLLEIVSLLVCLCVLQASWPASFWTFCLSHFKLGVLGFQKHVTSSSSLWVLEIGTQVLTLAQN